MAEQIQFVLTDPNAKLPNYGSEYAAGMDLYASKATTITSGERGIVQTGLRVAIPTGHYGRVAPRSGLAAKKYIDVCAGVIDEDYRGLIGVVLHNHSDQDFVVQIGDRIAQFIIEKISRPQPVTCEELPATLRGGGGFGSTGK